RAPDGAACSHCGLPVPRALQRARGNEQFCCSGCRVVYSALRDNGLLAYYDKRAAFEEDAVPRAPALATGGSYAHFDDPQFIELYSESEGEFRQLEFYLEGLHCPACIWLVEKLPNLVNGVV